MDRRWMRLISLCLAACVLSLCVCMCGAAVRPAAPRAAALPQLPAETSGWRDSYLGYLENNYSTLISLWPDGISGVGFIDLDLDGTPEMVLFDQGASSAMGAQLFDLIDGKVWCVSSTLDSAGAVLGSDYMSSVDICASFFESFRLTLLDQGWRFWIDSANGTLETTWDEIVRFDGVNGVLTPVSVCARHLESDVNTGLVVSEAYTVGGAAGSAADYQQASSVYIGGQDAGYEAGGVFLWNDMNAYGTTSQGLMAMARDAADRYTPVNG